ncbi:Capsule assembly protein Wzi [Spirosomataceae bacterium TFI 002]|nr:Capsule assembly protein Wzi [Spirosomataceae bacterium TFI 002]
MNFGKCIWVAIVLSLQCFTALAQEDTTQIRKKFSYSFELGGYASINQELPFWLKSNQYGAVPKSANSTYFRQQIESKTDTSAKFFHVNYCVDIMTFVGNEAKLIIPEAFLDFRFGPLSISGGRIKGVMGLVDSTLSSGSITWSGNALPIPEVRIAIPEYRKFIFKWLAVKGHYSHGWFGDQVTVKNSFFHQKSLYARLGKPEKKIHLYGGLLHNAQWGGSPKYTLPEGDDRLTNGKFPQDWFTYGQVVFPYQARQDSSGTYGLFEETNRFGNHIGQFDLGGTIDFKNTLLTVYKQTIFETGVTFSSLTNTDDGLYGLSLKNKKEDAVFQKVVFEFLHTLNQGAYQSGLARLLKLEDRQYGWSTYYFNHMQYQDGWSFKGKGIGTPFAVPEEYIKVSKKTFGSEVFLNNNRIKVGYLGAQFKLNSILLQTRMSLSRNYGSQFVKYKPADQVSFLINSSIPLPKLKGILGVRIGIDQGELIKDNYGANISFRRNW